MRAVVTGGRDYQDLDQVDHVITGLVTETGGRLLVAQGGARGADALTRRVCERRGVPCVTFPADWDRHGRAAGPIRNQVMLEVMAPDVVIVFPGGRGTADTMRRAHTAGIPVRVI